jgi:hypothetical protein
LFYKFLNIKNITLTKMTTIENILGKDKYIKADLQIKAKELGITDIQNYLKISL